MSPGRDVAEPLFGKRIAITRTREQAGALRDQLTGLGAEVIEIATIEIRDPASWEPLDSAIRRLEEFDYLLVTSVNGVRKFLHRLEAGGQAARDLNGLVIGAIGPATAAEISKSGVKVDIVPRQYTAEGLLEALGDRDLRGKAFLIPRAKVARDVVPRVLRQKGARVEVVEAYETVVPELPAGELRRLLTPPPDVITSPVHRPPAISPSSRVKITSPNCYAAWQSPPLGRSPPQRSGTWASLWRSNRLSPPFRS